MRFLIAFLALLLPVVAWGQPSPGQGHATITSGTINGAVIGGTTPAPVTATTLTATGQSSNVPALTLPITPSRPTISAFGGLLTSDDAGAIIPSAYAQHIVAQSTLSSYFRFNDVIGSTVFADSKGSVPLTPNGGTMYSGTYYSQPGLLAGGGLGPVAPTGSAWQDASNSTYFASGYAQAASSSSLSFEYNNTFSMSFLVRPAVTRSGGAANYTIISKRNGASTYQGYAVDLYWTNAKTVIQVNLFNNTTNYNVVQGSTDLANGAVHHIVVTYDGVPTDATGGVKIYVDGIAETLTISHQTLGSNSMVSTVPVTFGAEASGSSNYLVGSIQEFAVFTSVLSQNEINYEVGLYQGRTPLAQPTYPVNVILDNDMSDDVGNSEFYAVAYYLQKAGYIKILAETVCDVGTQVNSAGYSAAVVQAIQAYENVKYGQPLVPIGAIQSSLITTDVVASPTVAGNWYTGSYVASGTSPWTLAHFSALGLTPVPVMRQALANAANGSVVIVAAGISTNLSALLNSSADGISSLTGSQLIAAKVSRLIWTAGRWPVAGATETNMSTDITSSQNVFNNWPTEIVVPGIEMGDNLYAGPMLSQSTYYNVNSSIYQYLFAQSAPETNGKRQAWDALPMLFAAAGIGTMFDVGGLRGTTTVSGGGLNSWAATAGNTTYLTYRSTMSNTLVSNIVNSIMNAR